MQFQSLQDEFQYIHSLRPELPLHPDACLEYALAHENSLIRQHLLPRDQAAREFHLLTIRQLIRVHYKVVATESAEPIRAWVAIAPEDGHRRGYLPVEEVLADADRRRALVLAEIERLWSIYSSYKLPELQRIADAIETCRRQYRPPLAEAAE